MEIPNHVLQFLPIILLIIPTAIVVNRLAIEKGKNIVLWTILACIPVVNIVSVLYVVGTSNKKQDEKLDRILELLNERKAKIE